MTAQTTEHTTVGAAPVNYPPASEIDFSCRWPVSLLLWKSAGWLVLSLILGLFAAVKMHAPGMFAEVGALTYGRLAGAASTAFYYGFASQAAIAVSLWLFARLGRTFLVLPRASIVAGLVWNLAVLLGVIGILLGGMNHYPMFEMPGWIAPVLLAAFVILGLSGVLTYAARIERENYPTTWFLFAAFFVFPWILAAGWLLLTHYPIRGVLQPILATWFSNNFLAMWLTPVAFGILFYLVPKISGQPLHSYYLVVFGFWGYLLLAPSTGFQNIAAVPNWLPNMSRFLNVLLAVPALAILISWYRTWAGHNRARKQKDPSSRYVTFSVLSFAAGSLLVLALSCPVIDEVVGLTTFVSGTGVVVVYGFITMALFAAILHILPRITETEWPKPSLTTAHYALTVAGIVVCVLAWLLGGYSQGLAWNNVSVSALDASRRIVPFVGVNTLGVLLLLAGQIVLLAHMALLMKSCCARCCGFGGAKGGAR